MGYQESCERYAAFAKEYGGAAAREMEETDPFNPAISSTDCDGNEYTEV